MSWYTAKIDRVTQVLESSQYQDEALATAWRIGWIAASSTSGQSSSASPPEGGLAEGWSVDAAVDLIYVVTMPGAWRELTRERGWTTEHTQHLTRLIRSAFLTE